MKMMAAFRVDGKPTGKGRPRVAMRGKHPHVYTPETTRKYEQKVREAFLAEYPDFEPTEHAVELDITASMPIPKSWPKSKKHAAQNGKIEPLSKPDLSNILKIIEDGLNGVAYKDDSQVTVIYGEKEYRGGEPSVLVRISYWEDKQ